MVAEYTALVMALAIGNITCYISLVFLFLHAYSIQTYCCFYMMFDFLFRKKGLPEVFGTFVAAHIHTGAEKLQSSTCNITALQHRVMNMKPHA